MTPRHFTSEVLLRSAVAPAVHGLWRTRIDRENFDQAQGPCFLYGNHSNNLDAFIFNVFRPWGRVSSGVLTAEYMRGGLVTWALQGIGLLATRKRVPEPHLIPRIMRLLDAGRMVFIYPEGGRRWDGRPAPWIEATAKLFARVGVPVYPIVTHGSYVAWPRWAKYPRPAHLRVEVRPPVPVSRSLSLADNLKLLAEPIAADENVVSDDIRPRWAFRPADGIDRLLYRDPTTGENGGLFTPDGERIHNRSGSVRWRMLPDSRILDERSGHILLTADLYRQVRSLELQPEPDGSLMNAFVDHYMGSLQGAQTLVGPVRIRLFESHLEVSRHGHHQAIPLDSILYSGLERNSKWEITLRDSILRFDFSRRGSALQWDDFMSPRIAELRGGSA
jgi:1-acyl-sn-glycerol-3-phosphate acyltransferase